MKVVLASDHVGLTLKRAIGVLLTELKIDWTDIGTHTEVRVDYPALALRAATLVSSDKADRAVLICGTGVGMSIAANKVEGIRAVVCSEPYSAVLSRLHNDTNVLALGSRVVGSDLAAMIVRLWLDTDFEGGRHAGRVAQISLLEGHHGS